MNCARTIFTIFKRDCAILLSEQFSFISSLFNVIILFVIYKFIFSDFAFYQNNYFALIWIILVSTIFVNCSNIFEDDYKDGTLMQYKSFGVKNTNLFLAKIVFVYFTRVLPVIFISYGVFLLQDIKINNLALSVINILLASFNFSVLTCFVLRVIIGAKNNFLTAIMGFPFYLPIIIFSLFANYCDSIEEYASFISIQIGYCIMILTVSLFSQNSLN